jgi:hypothetical protein
MLSAISAKVSITSVSEERSDFISGSIRFLGHAMCCVFALFDETSEDKSYPRQQKFARTASNVPSGTESILMAFVLRRPKALSAEMPSPNPSPITASALLENARLIRTQVPSRYPSWMQMFRPCALGLIGLIIAVVLWGTGYKLSLYHHDAAPSSKVPVAKFWIESRTAPMAAVSRLKAKSHLVPGSQAFSAPIQRLPLLSRAAACIFPVCARGVVYFNFLIPFRSPPSHRFCLA